MSDKVKPGNQDGSSIDQKAAGLAKSLTRIDKLIRELASERKRRKPDRRRLARYYWTRGEEIVLTPALAKRLETIIRKIIKTGDLASHPYDVVETQVLQEVLHYRPRSNSSPARAVIDSLSGKVRDWKVFVPISGLALESGVSFDFGKDIRVLQLNADIFESEIMSVDAVVLESKRGAESFLEADRKRLAWFQNLPCVIFQFKGLHSSVGSELLETRVSPIVAFLQYCATITSLQGQNPVVDATGRFSHHPTRLYPLIAADAFMKHNLTGGRTALLTNVGAKFLRKQGVAAIAPLFGGNSPDDDESYGALLRRAIENFSDGERALSARQGVMSYVTCLEVFFNSPTYTEHIVCCGVAYAFTNDPVEMKKYYLAAQSLYGERSVTTHRGKMPKRTAEHRRLAMHTILRMIQKRGEFKDKVELDRWRNDGVALVETVVARPARGSCSPPLE